MGKFNKNWFSQIMINRLLKNELNQLKKIITKKNLVTSELSYGDVISFLVEHYKKNTVEYPIEQKLKVSVPLKQVKPLSISSKLDGKTRISFSVEN